MRSKSSKMASDMRIESMYVRNGVPSGEAALMGQATVWLGTAGRREVRAAHAAAPLLSGHAPAGHLGYVRRRAAGGRTASGPAGQHQLRTRSSRGTLTP